MKHIQVVFDFYLSCFHVQFQDALTYDHIFHPHELRGSKKPARFRLKRLNNLQMDGLCWSYDFCHLQAVHAKNFNYNDKYKSDAVSIAADS